jgi:hypothetical protein
MAAAEGGGTAKAEERRRHKSTDPVTGVEKLSRPLTLQQFKAFCGGRREAKLIARHRSFSQRLSDIPVVETLKWMKSYERGR